jgi:hypothetical protein
MSKDEKLNWIESKLKVNYPAIQRDAVNQLLEKIESTTSNSLEVSFVKRRII